MTYSKEQFLRAAESGEVNHHDAKHIVSCLYDIVVEDLIEEVGGADQYEKSATFNWAINQLAKGESPIHVIKSLCEIVDKQASLNAEILLNQMP